MFQKKGILFILIFMLTITVFTGCAKSNDDGLQSGDGESAVERKPASSRPENSSQAKAIIRLGALKGPSSLGMLKIMDNNDQKKANNIYEVTLAGAPSDIQAKIINGELDIAAIPINMAAALYNKSEKDISVIAVNTLGVLYLLTKDEEINTFSDLEDKTVYATGQGSTPEYVLNYLLENNGMKDKVTVEYKSEHAELAALMGGEDVKIAMLPQPFVTTVMSKDSSVKIALDLNEEWRKASGGTELAMTCIIVRNKFLETSKTAVDKFLDEYKESAEFVNVNVDEAAALSQKYDIIPEAVAKKAIPKCGIIFLSGDDVKTSVNPVLEVLFSANPQSIGGALPDDAFYYKR